MGTGLDLFGGGGRGAGEYPGKKASGITVPAPPKMGSSASPLAGVRKNSWNCGDSSTFTHLTVAVLVEKNTTKMQ